MMQKLAQELAGQASRMYRVALRIVGDTEAAQEVAQDACVKALRGVEKFDGRAALATWLHRITANHCLNLLRRRHPHESLDQEGAPSPADPGATPLEALEEQELSRRLEQLLDALPENQRRALVLKRFAGLSYQEIGEEMGLSAQAVDGLLKRARQFLKKALQD